MIRLAKLSDLEETFEIIKSAKEKHKKENIKQWNEFYPNSERIKKDIISQEMFISIEKSEIKACLCISKNIEEMYTLFPFENIAILHRIAVHPRYLGTGAAKKLFKFAEEYAQKNKIEYLLIDTNPDNIGMNHLIKSQNYKTFYMKEKIENFIKKNPITEENKDWIQLGLTYNYYYKKLGSEENEI